MPPRLSFLELLSGQADDVLEASVLGILTALLTQLQSGRWSHVVSGLAHANPLALLLVYRSQRAASAARCAAVPYFGGTLVEAAAQPTGATLAELRALRRAAAHAFGVYGA